jgi:hypothetical protein
MKQRMRIVLGFLIAYLILCLGAATGVTLPGDHSVRGFDVSLAFFAFGGSIEAVYDCPGKKVEIVAHDTTGSFRSARQGTLVFTQPGTPKFTTAWHFNSQDPSPNQVIATVSTAQTLGTWTVQLQEDPSVSTTFQVNPGTCPTASPTPTPTLRSTPTPTPAVTCPSPYTYDARTGKCVRIGSTGLG